jgi:hypothetical protein
MPDAHNLRDVQGGPLAAWTGRLSRPYDSTVPLWQLLWYALGTLLLAIAAAFVAAQLFSPVVATPRPRSGPEPSRPHSVSHLVHDPPLASNPRRTDDLIGKRSMLEVPTTGLPVIRIRHRCSSSMAFWQAAGAEASISRLPREQRPRAVALSLRDCSLSSRSGENAVSTACSSVCCGLE